MKTNHRVYGPIARLVAWGVHVYTAMGLVLAASIAVLIVRGTAHSLALALGLMWIATLIDATDGALARRARVKEVLPGFDGRRLDDLSDFLTYTFLPLLLVWRAGLLPETWSLWLLFPLVASAYGFCQSDAKTDDGFFLGFPSYWNIIALYLYMLQPPGWLSLTIILLFATLTFVPSRYLYSTQPGRLNHITNYLGGAWAIFIGWLIYELYRGSFSGDPERFRTLAICSLLFPGYYLSTSWVITVKRLLSPRP